MTTTISDRQLPQEALVDLFRAHGWARVETPILQPADLFLDLSGEDIRRRLLLTQDSAGRDFCLRPEYTIPVCREHLQAGAPAGSYCYLGPVFRQRAGEPSEFQQAGIESLGRPDVPAADADVLGLALDGLALFPFQQLEVRLGDMALLGALLDALAIGRGVRRRLIRDLAAGRGTAAVLDPEPRPAQGDYAGLLDAIAGQDPRAARAFVEDVISIAGIAPVGGRSASEIAERFLSRAENRSGAMSDRARDVLRSYLAIDDEPDAASAAIRRLAEISGLDLGMVLATFDDRIGFLAARGVDVSRLRFEAGFARSLDYYTGFIFEARDRARTDGKYAVAGGRYDGLLQQLGAPAPVPAVGCSFWLDRLGEAGA